MTGEILSIIFAALAVVGQAVNVFLHLRIRTAILESEQQERNRADNVYVLKETCRIRHHVSTMEIN